MKYVMENMHTSFSMSSCTKKNAKNLRNCTKPCIYITYFAAQRSNLPATVQWILEAFNENTQDCDLSATHKHGWVNRSLRK